MTGARRLDLLTFALVFVVAGFFFNGWGWNQTARYDAIWAFVEPGPNRGTVRIDDFLVDPEGGVNTGDWARNPEEGEHYYVNKAPGTTLLGIPFYATLYGVESVAGLDPRAPAAVMVNAYLIHLWVTVLPLALSAVFFRRFLSGTGLGTRRAVSLTIVLYLGTLMLPFSTAMWGHTTAAAFVVMALSCFTMSSRRAWIWSGVLAGAAVLTDYGAGPFALSLVALAALVPRYRDRTWRVVVGGAGPLAIFLGYHWALFGSPFTLASSYSPGEMINERYVLGLFGVPRLAALESLTVSTARGLFVFMPVLLLALVGAWRIRGHSRTELGWLALFNVVAALLMNMSFNAWQGGVAAGPRYLITSLPFWVLLLAFLPAGAGGGDARLSRGEAGAPGAEGVEAARFAGGDGGGSVGRWFEVVFWTLAAVSVANMLVIAAVSPMAPDAFRGSPLFFCWAKIFWALKIDLGIDPVPSPGGSLSRGSLHVYPTIPLRDWGIAVTSPLYERWASFNLGERLLGLRGTWSLVPVLVLGGVLGWGVLREASELEDA